MRRMGQINQAAPAGLPRATRAALAKTPEGRHHQPRQPIPKKIGLEQDKKRRLRIPPGFEAAHSLRNYIKQRARLHTVALKEENRK